MIAVMNTKQPKKLNSYLLWLLRYEFQKFVPETTWWITCRINKMNYLACSAVHEFYWLHKWYPVWIRSSPKKFLSAMVAEIWIPQICSSACIDGHWWSHWWSTRWIILHVVQCMNFIACINDSCDEYEAIQKK